MPAAAAGVRERTIYIACPWTPVGGGMFKVADYLIQSQSPAGPAAAQLRPLDTRGGAHAVFSLWVLLTALAKLVRGRLDGTLALYERAAVRSETSLAALNFGQAAIIAVGVTVIMILAARGGEQVQTFVSPTVEGASVASNDEVFAEHARYLHAAQARTLPR